jgi:UrcA family protein
MSRSLLAAVAAFAMTALPQAPAISQESGSITVTGPTARNSGEPADGVRQRTRLTSAVTVDFADLDLRTEYGRWVLDQRLRIAADAACDELDAVDPPSGMGGGIAYSDCRSLAMRRAEPQLRRAILAAG